MPSYQLLLPMLAAICTATAVDLAVAGRGLPPGFAVPWRRAVASGLMAGILFLGTFSALAVVTPGEAVDLSGAAWWDIFTLHLLMAVTLFAWVMLAWGGRAAAAANVEASAEADGEGPLPWRLDAEATVPPGSLGGRLAAELGLAVAPGRSIAAEIGIGLVVGVVVWYGLSLVLAGVVSGVEALGGPNLRPEESPQLVSFLVAQPFAVRLGASLSAGLCEETFFRGFLQPRLGVAFSSLLFVLAHWNYGSPFMLVGVALLSLAYAGLARWRGNVWAAAAAHAAFDGIQLLWLLPWALEQA